DGRWPVSMVEMVPGSFAGMTMGLVREEMMSEGKGFVVAPGGGALLHMGRDRFAALKLLSGETGGSVMLFVRTAPGGPETPFPLHRDSAEVAYVLSGQITFKIGDEVTVGGAGTCAFLPRGVPHAWKNTGAETGQVLFLYTPAAAGKFFEERLACPGGEITDAEALEMRRRHGWEVVGPPPFLGRAWPTAPLPIAARSP